MILVYLLGALILVITSVTLHMIESTKHVNDKYLRHLFRFFPSFCLGDTIFWLAIRTILPYVRMLARPPSDIDLACVASSSTAGTWTYRAITCCGCPSRRPST